MPAVDPAPPSTCTCSPCHPHRPGHKLQPAGRQLAANPRWVSQHHGPPPQLHGVGAPPQDLQPQTPPPHLCAPPGPYAPPHAPPTHTFGSAAPGTTAAAATRRRLSSPVVRPLRPLNPAPSNLSPLPHPGTAPTTLLPPRGASTPPPPPPICCAPAQGPDPQTPQQSPPHLAAAAPASTARRRLPSPVVRPAQRLEAVRQLQGGLPGLTRAQRRLCTRAHTTSHGPPAFCRVQIQTPRSPPVATAAAAACVCVRAPVECRAAALQ